MQHRNVWLANVRIKTMFLCQCRTSSVCQEMLCYKQCKSLYRENGAESLLVHVKNRGLPLRHELTERGEFSGMPGLL